MPQVRCEICKKQFYAKPSWLKRGWGKYCSSKCQYQARLKGKFVNCVICGKKIWRQPHEFKHSKSRKFFCSKSCQTIWRNQIFVGPKHPLWKGGGKVKYRNILSRNGIKPKCKLCGCKDKRILVVHHRDKKRSNNTIKNLVWLCLNCHHLVHYYKDQVKIK